MQTPSPRLIPTRSLPLRGGSADGWSRSRTPPGDIVRLLRAVRRSILILIWSIAALAPQAMLMHLPGQAKVRYARFYWAAVCRLFGLQVRVVGQVAEGGARPMVFVSNHTSWLDVAVLGGVLPGCFVSKDVVKGWPLINLIAYLGRTVYVSRQRQTTGRERDAMRQRIDAGDSLILFPEGTTSDGSRVLPFRSSLLAVAMGEPAPLIQPVSVVYDRLAGLPAGRHSRPLFSYYGDMTMGPHFWMLVQWRGQRASVVLHAPIDPRDYADRKALSRAVWQTVADGAAMLRQNRPAAPIATKPPIGRATMPSVA